MLDDGYIDRGRGRAGRAREPLVLRQRAPTETVEADYFVEEVRRELVAQLRRGRLYQGGLSVRTTRLADPAGARRPGAAARPDRLRPPPRLARPRGAARPAPSRRGLARPSWIARPRASSAGSSRWSSGRCRAAPDRPERRQHGDAAARRADLGAPGRCGRQPGPQVERGRSGARRRRRDLGGAGRADERRGERARRAMPCASARRSRAPSSRSTRTPAACSR